jgi:hypothetical protein
MSNKTLKQRIALVAASALTAGFLSVVAAPSANAIGGEDGQITSTAGSVGLIAAGTTASNTVDTTKTAVLLSTGSLTLTIAEASTVVVSAGARITSNSQSANAGISADQTCSTVLTGGAGKVTITPTGVIGTTFTVSTYAENACADAATLNEKVTVTIAGTDASGVAVAANSYINWTANGSTTATTESAADAADVTGGLLYIYVQLRDAYKANITSTSGALIATASSGAVTKIDASGLATAGTATTAVSAASPAALYVSVGEATAGAGWAGTVTISYNGVVLATKSGKITGKPTKLTIAALKVGKNDGSANAAALSYQVTDSVNNNVVVPYADIVYSSSTVTALVSAAAGSVVNTTDTVGNATFTCANSATAVGTTDLVMQTTLSDGTIIKSNALTVRCGGAAAKYTASWDKATYAQGDVAILTVSFTDLVGSPANSYDAVSASTNQVITALQMERVTAHSSAATPGSSSTIAYTFTVGTASGVVPGAYQAVISYPTVNTAGSTLKTGNIAAGYSIVAPASVSNADVLKSIVALIASINKQIQALQKLILKR